MRHALFSDVVFQTETRERRDGQYEAFQEEGRQTLNSWDKPAEIGPQVQRQKGACLQDPPIGQISLQISKWPKDKRRRIIPMILDDNLGKGLELVDNKSYASFVGEN
ncbi:hypothetical protein ACLOJK_027457 [Asimina triloba]